MSSVRPRDGHGRSQLVALSSLLPLLASVWPALRLAPTRSTKRLPTYAAANAAEIAQRPVGFADLVEKVKPAVISVRVKVTLAPK